eukprot:1953825-Rhodomonas_salina.3
MGCAVQRWGMVCAYGVRSAVLRPRMAQGCERRVHNFCSLLRHMARGMREMYTVSAVDITGLRETCARFLQSTETACGTGLRETCGRFLQSMRPLLSIHDFEFTANRIA